MVVLEVADVAVTELIVLVVAVAVVELVAEVWVSVVKVLQARSSEPAQTEDGVPPNCLKH